MIDIENAETGGWEAALRGMRNPLNSWDKADSKTEWLEHPEPFSDYGPDEVIDIGPKDYDLAMRLRNAGTDHRKYLRMIVVWCDITAPLYWWKEFDTYRAGVEKNSCSTMHTIAEKEFDILDFSYENLHSNSQDVLYDEVIPSLNFWRKVYLKGGEVEDGRGRIQTFEPKDKDAWWQLIQLLPSSYDQKRTVMISYEALANMYHARKSHKLNEWREFCRWVETLPYSELITGERA